MKQDIQMNTYAATPLTPPPYPGAPEDAPGRNNMYPPAPTVTGGPNVTTTTVIVTNSIGPVPAVYVCPSCNQQIVTRIKRVPSMRTHIMAVLLCIFACWPCVCIPYCVDSCKNVDHYCVNCEAYIGTHQV